MNGALILLQNYSSSLDATDDSFYVDDDYIKIYDSNNVEVKRNKKTREYMLELALRIIFYKVHKIKSKFLNLI